MNMDKVVAGGNCLTKNFIICTLLKCDYQMNNGVMGKACSTYEMETFCVQNSGRRLEEARKPGKSEIRLKGDGTGMSDYRRGSDW
jgi:hypothetical protein